MMQNHPTITRMLADATNDDRQRELREAELGHEATIARLSDRPAVRTFATGAGVLIPALGAALLLI